LVENFQEKDEQTKQIEQITNSTDKNELTFEKVIRFLQSIQQNYHAYNQSNYKLDQLQRQTKQDKVRIVELEKELKETRSKLKTIEEDYKMFIQIMDRARKMSVLDEKDQQYATGSTFRMDKNGNLEQFAQGSN